MSERDLEAPEADAIEQDARVVADDDDDPDLGAATSLSETSPSRSTRPTWRSSSAARASATTSTAEPANPDPAAVTRRIGGRW